MSKTICIIIKGLKSRKRRRYSYLSPGDKMNGNVNKLGVIMVAGKIYCLPCYLCYKLKIDEILFE